MAEKRMTTFTPCPWDWHFDGHGGICIESDGKQIGFISKNPEQEANARLIAAAPEMYEIICAIAQRMNTGESVYGGKLREDMNDILHKVDNSEPV